VKDKAWMFHQLFAYFFAMMCADMIAHEMNRLECGGQSPYPTVPESDEFLLTLTGVTLPKDGSRPGTECRK